MKLLHRSVIITLISLVIFSACQIKKDAAGKETECTNGNITEKTTINQGVAGTITFTEGNCMPGVINGEKDRDTPCRSYPVKRTLHIYKCTSTREIESRGGGFYDNPNTSLIKSITSDEKGFFEAVLPQGSYSIFIEEKGQLYANRIDGDGNLLTIRVAEGEVTIIGLEINHAAYY